MRNRSDSHVDSTLHHVSPAGCGAARPRPVGEAALAHGEVGVSCLPCTVKSFVRYGSSWMGPRARRPAPMCCAHKGARTPLRSSAQALFAQFCAGSEGGSDAQHTNPRAARSAPRAESLRACMPVKYCSTRSKPRRVLSGCDLRVARTRGRRRAVGRNVRVRWRRSRT